jgi:hypothetical protein
VNDFYKRLMASRLANDTRYCTQCRCQRPRKGGREIAFNGGMNARWVCGLHGDMA